MFITNLVDFEKACKIVRNDGYFAKAKDGLPKNMPLLEKATELQITAFVAHRHGINEHVIPWMPSFTLFPSPIKKYQALMIVDRGNRTFVETLDGFKVARLDRAEHGIKEPIMHQSKSVIINLSEHQVVFGFFSAFFTSLYVAYYEGKKNALMKRMFRK